MAGLSYFCCHSGRADPVRRGQHFHHRGKRRDESSGRGRRARSMVSEAAPALRHDVSHHQSDHDSSDHYGDVEQRPDLSAGRGVRIRYHMELLPESAQCRGASIPTARSGIQDSGQYNNCGPRDPVRPHGYDARAVLCGSSQSHLKENRDDFWRVLHCNPFRDLYDFGAPLP